HIISTVGVVYHLFKYLVFTGFVDGSIIPMRSDHPMSGSSKRTEEKPRIHAYETSLHMFPKNGRIQQLIPQGTARPGMQFGIPCILAPGSGVANKFRERSTSSGIVY